MENSISVIIIALSVLQLRLVNKFEFKFSKFHCFLAELNAMHFVTVLLHGFLCA